ncbi:hypothetical protein PYJP_06210 [Pyrofollis japonicus]|uniref:CRISPR-associated endonuclease Cas3'' n=1 Tax=Pyrofollis japonicus TaxID=3060460 RepID=UPI00295AEBB7|nr:CRISPR-associated endonuclease Cas3'' [Pyrofollis japonicus]BEP17269.1 hypothetical protein PYJP_06210 [Pyrofollis japonicus]
MTLYAWTGVRLGLHSVNVAALLLGLFGDELHVTAKRLQLPEHTVLEAAVLAALLHDAGKAAKKFQKTILSGSPSFVCHEVLSAGLVHHVAKRLLARETREQEKILVIAASIAVLRHHHGLRNIAWCSEAISKGLVPALTPEEIQMIAKELEACLPSNRVSATLCQLAEKHTEIRPLTALRTVKQAARAISSPLLTITSSQLTGALSLADYLAASLLDGRRGDQEHLRSYAGQALRELEWKLEGDRDAAEALRELATREKETLRVLLGLQHREQLL